MSAFLDRKQATHDHVGVRVPAVRVERRVLALVCDLAWPQFEQEARHGAASRAAVEPEEDWVVLWVVSGLEEPFGRVSKC